MHGSPCVRVTCNRAWLTLLVTHGHSDCACAPHIITCQVCEEGLFTSSHERKHLALQLFQLLLPRTPAAAVPSLFSRNLVRTLADNLRVPGAFLHAMARRVMVRLQLDLTVFTCVPLPRS